MRNKNAKTFAPLLALSAPFSPQFSAPRHAAPIRPKFITPVLFPVASPQQVRNINDKSIATLKQVGVGQKSVVSVVSCRFPNSITTTYCGLVGRVANKSATSWQLSRLRRSYGEAVCVVDFGQCSLLKVGACASVNLYVDLRALVETATVKLNAEDASEGGSELGTHRAV